MSYPSSGSTNNGRTSAGLSPQILVKVGNTTVGAIQSLGVTQDRDMVTVEEIGNDGIIEIHPKGSAKLKLNVKRIVFDNLRLPEALGRGFVNIQSQRIPFDILLLDRSTVREESGVVERGINRLFGSNLSTGAITRGLSDVSSSLGNLGVGIKATEPYMGHSVFAYNNCWIRHYETTYEASNYLIMESVDIVCEYATAMIEGKNIATGGSRGIQYDYDTIERVTDLTGNRGKFYAVVDDRSFGKRLVDALF